MRLYDKNRPKNGIGQLLMQDGNIVPSFNLDFSPNDSNVRLTAWLQSKGSGKYSYRPYYKTMDIASVKTWMLDFITDPEKAILEYFGYSVMEGEPAKPRERVRIGNVVSIGRVRIK
jgi:hypothetical protein